MIVVGVRQASSFLNDESNDDARTYLEDDKSCFGKSTGTIDKQLRFTQSFISNFTFISSMQKCRTQISEIFSIKEVPRSCALSEVLYIKG